MESLGRRDAEWGGGWATCGTRGPTCCGSRLQVKSPPWSRSPRRGNEIAALAGCTSIAAGGARIRFGDSNDRIAGFDAAFRQKWSKQHTSIAEFDAGQEARPPTGLHLQRMLSTSIDAAGCQDVGSVVAPRIWRAAHRRFA